MRAPSNVDFDPFCSIVLYKFICDLNLNLFLQKSSVGETRYTVVNVSIYPFSVSHLEGNLLCPCQDEEPLGLALTVIRKWVLIIATQQTSYSCDSFAFVAIIGLDVKQNLLTKSHNVKICDVKKAKERFSFAKRWSKLCQLTTRKYSFRFWSLPQQRNARALLVPALFHPP